MADGGGLAFDEEEAAEVLKAKEIKILIDLHDGEESAIGWGCDLSYDYVKINAEYRSQSIILNKYINYRESLKKRKVDNERNYTSAKSGNFGGGFTIY